VDPIRLSTYASIEHSNYFYQRQSQVFEELGHSCLQSNFQDAAAPLLIYTNILRILLNSLGVGPRLIFVFVSLRKSIGKGKYKQTGSSIKIVQINCQTI